MNLSKTGLFVGILLLSGTAASFIYADNSIQLPSSIQKYDSADIATLKKNALDLLENRTLEGETPGCYSTSDRETFKNAIEKAVSAEEIADAIQTYIDSVITVSVSDDNNEYWYYISSGSSSSGYKGTGLYDTSLASGENLKWNDTAPDPRFMWKFVDAGDGRVLAVNKFSHRAIYNPGVVAGKTTSEDEPENATPLSIESLGEQRAFALKENTVGNVIYAYRDGTAVSAKSASLGNNGAWIFDPVPQAVVEEIDMGNENWELVWADEFNVDGPVDPECWTFEKGFVRNSEPQWYQEDNAICKDGNLVITARKERVANPKYDPESSNWMLNREYAEYTSSSIISERKVDLLYGRMEIRAKIPVSSGAWPAIWAKGYPQTNGSWPACGEIDILEYYKKSIFANVAWSNASGTAQWRTVQTPFTHFTDRDSEWADKYHVWALEWDEESIRLYLDDELLNTTAQSRTVQPVGDYCKTDYPFRTPMFILLNLALNSSDGIDESCFPISYYVDYVRFFQKKSNGGSSRVETVTDTEQNWLIYDNGKISIHSGTFSGVTDIQVFDISGKTVCTGTTSPADNTYTLPDLDKGIYIVTASAPNERRSQKIAIK